MAKLNGVQVIDMVGGEVTKIAYEGEEYAKVEDEGRATEGDLIYTISSLLDTLPNSFYKVVRNGYGDGRFYDEAGDSCKVLSTPCTIFRKTSAQPTLTDRVETLESKVAALEEGGKKADEFVKIDRKPRVGDYVKYTDTSWSDITVGKYYEITGFSLNGYAKFIDDVNDVNTAVPCTETFEFYEKVSDTPTKVIEGDPQVGDKIRIVDAELSFGDYSNGEIHTVVKLRNDISKGAVEIDVEGSAYVNRREFEIIARPEKAEEPALKVGDYVRVISEGEYGGVDVGEIGKIVTGYGELGEYRVDNLTESDHDYFTADQLVLATDEEVAEAKRKLAEEKEAKKWAEIGRKPNEFKSGDIVRVTTCSYGGHNVGTIGELVDELSWEGTHRVMANGEVYSQDYELITPVEHRFDR